MMLSALCCKRSAESSVYGTLLYVVRDSERTYFLIEASGMPVWLS